MNRARPAPYSNGQIQVGIRKVRCPYDGTWIEVPANVGDFVSVQVAKGNLDEAHRMAAQYFERIIERAMSHGLSIAPFAQERVQTSGAMVDIPSRVIEAQKELALIASYLGKRNYALIHSVIMDGLNASLLSQSHIGERSPYHRKEVAKRIREILDDLVQYFNLGTKKGEARQWAKTVRMVSEYPVMTIVETDE